MIIYNFLIVYLIRSKFLLAGIVPIRVGLIVLNPATYDM